MQIEKDRNQTGTKWREKECTKENFVNKKIEYKHLCKEKKKKVKKEEEKQIREIRSKTEASKYITNKGQIDKNKQ